MDVYLSEPIVLIDRGVASPGEWAHGPSSIWCTYIQVICDGWMYVHLEVTYEWVLVFGRRNTMLLVLWIGWWIAGEHPLRPATT